MKVILLKDVKGIGRANEIKDLSDGYVKNFLLPQGLGKLATDSVVKEVKLKVEFNAKEIDGLKKKLKELGELTKSKPLIFKIKTGEHKEVFGSISAEEIVKQFAARGFSGAHLEDYHPIRSLGRHIVEVNLGRGIKGEIVIEVVSQ